MNNENSNDEALLKFLNDPDTVDLTFKVDEYLIDNITSNPYIKFSQPLSNRYVIGYVNKHDIDNMRDILKSNFYISSSIILGLLDRKALQASGITQVQEQPYLSLTGKGVLIGVIDTGIDYTNPAFRYEDGSTKIYSIFDQSEISGSSPGGLFLLGTEYTREKINEALRSDDPYSIVPQRDTSGHGTFLASIMASREKGEYIGAAPDAELIVVKLKRARNYYLEQNMVPATQENAFESSAFMIGVEYVIQQAKKLNRPVAICVGIGTNSGSHYGYSLYAQYLEDIASISGVCICGAAGNESQASHHMREIISGTNGTANIEINSDDLGSSIYLTIINQVTDQISVSIVSPSGEKISRIPVRPGAVINTNLVYEKSKISIEYFYPITRASLQITIVRIQNAAPGIWTIIANGDIIANGRFDAYLPLTGLGYPGVKFMSPDPYYTIVCPATSQSTITVGAYNNNDNSLYVNSSWGPTLTPLNSPDFVAPGVNVNGIYPTGYGTMTGTSVAAAITTGAAALMMQWGIVEGNYTSLSTNQIKGFLIRGCIREEYMTYPNYQWGYGKLDLHNTFSQMV